MAGNCEIILNGNGLSSHGLKRLDSIVVENEGQRDREIINQEHEDIIAAKKRAVAHDGPLWGLNDYVFRGGYLYCLGDHDEGNIAELVGPVTYGEHAAFQGTDIPMQFRANPLSQNAVGLTTDGYLTLSVRGKSADRSGKEAFIGIGFLQKYPRENPEQVRTAVLREIVEEMNFPQLDMESVLAEIGDNKLIKNRNDLERALAGGYSESRLKRNLDRSQRATLAGYQRVLTEDIIDGKSMRFLGLVYDRVNGDTTNAVYVPFNIRISEISPSNTETMEMRPIKLTKANLKNFETDHPNCINHTYGDIELLSQACSVLNDGMMI